MSCTLIQNIFINLFILLCLWKDQIKITTRKLLPSSYSVLNTCFLSFFRLNEEARCNLQFRMHQNVAFSQILWPRTDKYDMKVWFGIFFWTLTPSHFFYEPCKSIRRRICFVVVLKANSGKTMLKIITNVQKACHDGKKYPIVWLQMSDCRKSKTLTHLWAKDIAYFITRDKRICVLKFKTQAWWGDEGKIDINKRHCLILWEIQKQQKSFRYDCYVFQLEIPLTISTQNSIVLITFG